MSTKNVTFRFQNKELEKYDSFAANIGVNRTTLIRRALDKYINSYSADSTEKSSAIDAAKTLVGITAEIKQSEKHPLYLLMKNEGLKISNSDGEVVATITNIYELLDFVNAKVLKR